MTSHIYTKRLGAIAIVFAAGLFVVACSSTSNPVAPTPTPGAPTVLSVVVTGASTTPGTPFQLTATARLSDATTRDVTGTATWLSSNAIVAKVSASGMVTILGGGEFDVRATYQNTTGSLHLLTAALPVMTVSVSGPATSTLSVQLLATATFSDGSTQDVTDIVHWQSLAPQFATVSAGGYVRIVSAGAVDLLATYQGVTGSIHVMVSVPATYRVSGLITGTAQDGQPIANARVQVFALGAEHVMSDAQGRFTVALPTGSAVIEVTKNGYQTWSTLVDITGDTDLVIVLTATPVSAVNITADLVAIGLVQ